MDEVFGKFEAMAREHPYMAYRLPRAVIDMGLSILTELGEERTEYERDSARFCGRLGFCLTLAAVKECVSECLEQMLARYEKSLQNRHTLPVLRAKEYIAAHYMDKLRVEAPAEYVHLNSQYLSVLFKKETDMTLKEYMTFVRLKEARRLLKDTNMSVQQIAVSVGYDDAKYLSRVFRNNVGVNPSEYRKIVRTAAESEA